MSRWISDENGKLHPAKEQVSLKNLSGKSMKVEIVSDSGKKFTKTVPPMGDYIYEGPDRAAMYQWWEENGKPSYEEIKAMPEGSITMGDDFRTNQEFMDFYAKYRQSMGFQNMKEFLTYLGYDEEKQKKRFHEKAQIVSLHELADRVPEIKKVGGGDDRANPGKNIRLGGWGEMPAEQTAEAR